MEDLDQINTGLSTIRQIVPLFRSLLEKAPTEGASEEFTRQLNDAVINMQQAVIDAQEMVLAGQATEAKLRFRVQELERQVKGAEKWVKEASRYKLVDLRGNKGMAYALREELSTEDEPMHYLCTSCFEDGSKSILQCTGMSIKPYDCPRCPR